MRDISIIKTYVRHGSKCFFVSTVERDSSELLFRGRHNETTVWEFDWDKVKRGEMIHQGKSEAGSITVHQAICLELFLRGRPEDI